MKTTLNLLSICCGLLLFSAVSSKAQGDFAGRFKKNNFLVSYGLGGPSPVRFAINSLIESNNELTANGYGPHLLKVEYGISNKFSIALTANYNYTDVHWMQNARNPANGEQQLYRHGVELWEAGVGLRGNYYFLKKKNWNCYAGLGAGLGHAELESYSFAPKERLYAELTFPTTITFEGTVGTRYFLAQNFALYTEVGIGQSWFLYETYFIPAALVQVGMSVQF